MDTPFHQNFQNQLSYPSFQTQSQQNDEPIDFKKMTEAMTQVQIAHNQEIYIMVNTLHSYPLTIPDVANYSVRAQESYCFENKIHTHHQFKRKLIILGKEYEILRESEQQSQNLVDSRFHHNFQN